MFGCGGGGRVTGTWLWGTCPASWELWVPSVSSSSGLCSGCRVVCPAPVPCPELGIAGISRSGRARVSSWRCQSWLGWECPQPRPGSVAAVCLVFCPVKGDAQEPPVVANTAATSGECQHLLSVVQVQVTGVTAHRHHREGAIPAAPPHRPAGQREGGEPVHSAAADDPREE